VFAEIDPSAERATLMNKINAILTKQDSSLIAFDIAPEVQQNIRFLNSTWSIIMMLPLFTLLSASLCLMAFIMLVIDEQRQEFGFLRAMGAKPKTVTTIVAIQSIVVLLSSCGVGLSLGTISTLLILMRQPLVTGLTIVEIAAWLFAASLGMFLLSLLPAVRFARTRILKTIS
jgi:ABC-type antimicrobial peptide transport system permease subunit